MKKNKGSGQNIENANRDGVEAEAGEVRVEAAADEMVQLKEALSVKEKDLSDLSEKYLRLAAEYDNFRRRSQKEKDAIYADAIAAVVREMLPVIDNIERAGTAASQFDTEETRKVAEGVEMIRRQVHQVLEKLGVSRIDCVGQVFDPQLHEAVMHVEDDGAGPSTIVTELQTGYQRDDRVIRHSMVKVAN